MNIFAWAFLTPPSSWFPAELGLQAWATGTWLYFPIFTRCSESICLCSQNSVSLSVKKETENEEREENTE
jgi:hypothetical protein